jgi:predicted lipoprotein with Yx(FWY)xxD motif
MRHPRTTIAVIAVAAAAGVSGIAAAASAGGPKTAAAGSKAARVAAAPGAPVVTPVPGTTIHAVNATVGGRSEAILVDAKGLPLYFYKPDTATKSFVSAGLASFWPPLVSTNPTVAGATGKLTVTHDASGAQVAYKGHFLYTFISDSPGQVNGQGVQDFFVATPGMPAIGGSSTSTPMAPVSGSGGIYGY